MSGHSKWSTIKHKKATADSKKGAVFTIYLPAKVKNESDFLRLLETAIARDEAN